MAESLGAFAYDFLVVLLTAFIATVASRRLDLPPVIALIFAGALIGPNALGVIGQEGSLIGLFSEIGAVLLLFYIGIEFNFTKLLRVGVKAAVFAIVKMTVVFLAAYEASLLLGIDRVTAVIVGFMLSITSTAIMIKILEQKGLSRRPEVKLLVAELIVEDLIAVMGITFVSSLEVTRVTLHETFASIAVSIVVLGATYLILRRIFSAAGGVLGERKSGDVSLFFSLTLCMALSLLASALGLTAAIGAFLAGSLLASIKVGHAARKVTESLGLAFSSVFFISVGMLTNPALIAAGIGVFAVLLAVQLAGAYAGVFMASRITGFDSKQAAFSASAMLVVGEFSLLLAREAAKISSIDIVGLASISVLVSTLVATFSVRRADEIRDSLARVVPKGIAEGFNSFTAYTSRVIRQLEFGGPLHSALLAEVSKRKADLWRLFAAGGLVVAANYFFRETRVLHAQGTSISFFTLASLILMLIALYSLARLAGSIARMTNLLEKTLSIGKRRKVLEYAKKNALVAAGFLALAVLHPTAIEFLSLPRELLFIQLALLFAAAFFTWQSVTAIRKMQQRKTS